MAASWKKAFLDACTRRLPSGTFQANPYFPDLLNQPDLLVVPEPGRLISIHQYDFRDRFTWRHVLGAVEDVFELKTSIGPHVAAVAVLSRLQEQHDQRAGDMTRLLSNAFDAVIQAPEQDDAGADERWYARIVEARPQERLSHLWQSELAFQQQALSRPFSGEDYAPLVRPDTHAEAAAAVRDRVLHVIESQPTRSVRKDQLVESIKPQIGQLERPYRFHFDYVIDTREPRPPLLLDLVDGRNRGMRERLRYLMAKVRLTRYWTIPDGIAIRAADYRHLMVVNGNLAGPGHDPYRYVRALLSVGWAVAHEAQVERIERIVENEDL